MTTAFCGPCCFAYVCFAFPTSILLLFLLSQVSHPNLEHASIIPGASQPVVPQSNSDPCAGRCTGPPTAQGQCHFLFTAAPHCHSAMFVSPFISAAASQASQWGKLKVRTNKHIKSILPWELTFFLTEQLPDRHLLGPGSSLCVMAVL